MLEQRITRPQLGQRLSCGLSPVTTQLGPHPRDTYSACQGGVTVSRVRVLSGGHTWPGGSQYLSEGRIGGVASEFSASQVIFDFFKATGAR